MRGVPARTVMHQMWRKSVLVLGLALVLIDEFRDKLMDNGLRIVVSVIGEISAP